MRGDHGERGWLRETLYRVVDNDIVVAFVTEPSASSTGGLAGDGASSAPATPALCLTCSPSMTRSRHTSRAVVNRRGQWEGEKPWTSVGSRGYSAWTWPLALTKATFNTPCR